MTGATTPDGDGATRAGATADAVTSTTVDGGVPAQTAPWAEILALPALEAAPLLLGAVLTVQGTPGEPDSTGEPVAVRLTEVEAYAGHLDPGSHAYRGLTPRTAPMFAAGGLLYVYFTYGMHWCANLVCGPAGTASAVLLRAGEIVEGHELARSRRPAARSDRELARGPARLAQALGLTGADSGLPLRVGGRADLVPHPPAEVVSTGPRVGVAGPGGDAEEFPWRFHLPGEPTVSVYRPGVPKRRRSASAT